MDFLDPKKKRARRIRLMIGYLLMTVVVAIGTVILVYEAYGFGYNRESGQVIQNGIVFVDSAPVSAEIFINSQRHESDTDARLVLPAGKYTFELKRQGYHDWKRTFTLEPVSLERLVYPMMVPTAFTPKDFDSLPGNLGLTTQSPDRRWLLNQIAPANSLSLSFSEYDTTVKPAPQKRAINLPANFVKADGGTLRELEWTSDNRHVLLEYSLAGSKEFLIADRENPASSININNLLSVAPLNVALRDKKTDQVYLLLPNENSLAVANIAQRSVGRPILKNIVDFKPYGADIVTYIASDGASLGNVRAAIWEKGQNFNLQALPVGDNYVVDAARYDDHWYYVIGSNKLDRVIIYKDPIAAIKDSAKKQASPMLALTLPAVQSAGFSANARFIGAQSGQNFAVYDIEAKDNFKYTLDSPITQPLNWMDGHRLLGVSNAKVYMTDFDGINRHTLVNTSLAKGAYFDRDYRQMYVVVPASSAQGFVLQRVSMFSEADTPDNLK